MKQKIKIGNFEAFCLLINLFCSKLILDFPRNVAEEAGTAAWIMVLLVSAAVFVIFIIIARIYKNFPQKDILDVAESGIGKLENNRRHVVHASVFLLNSHRIERICGGY